MAVYDHSWKDLCWRPFGNWDFHPVVLALYFIIGCGLCTYGMCTQQGGSKCRLLMLPVLTTCLSGFLAQLNCLHSEDFHKCDESQWILFQSCQQFRNAFFLVAFPFVIGAGAFFFRYVCSWKGQCDSQLLTLGAPIFHVCVQWSPCLAIFHHQICRKWGMSWEWLLLEVVAVSAAAPRLANVTVDEKIEERSLWGVFGTNCFFPFILYLITVVEGVNLFLGVTISCIAYSHGVEPWYIILNQMVLGWLAEIGWVLVKTKDSDLTFEALIGVRPDAFMRGQQKDEIKQLYAKSFAWAQLFTRNIPLLVFCVLFAFHTKKESTGIFAIVVFFMSLISTGGNAYTICSADAPGPQPYLGMDVQPGAARGDSGLGYDVDGSTDTVRGQRSGYKMEDDIHGIIPSGYSLED